MTGRRCLPLALLLALWPGERHRPVPPGDAADARIFSDRDRGVLVIDLAPVDLPAHTSHHELAQPPIATLELPVDGYIHGFRVDVVDREEPELPGDLIIPFNLLTLA